MKRLDTYHAKRDFSVTPEPQAVLGRVGTDRPAFVVQKHDARRVHYDFRLEWGGVLWSWAVTKGPSADPSQKRLAVRTEDHPLAYGDFEGTIPEGEYGGGTVMLWDQGWWEPLHDPEDGLEQGKLHFHLHGARMKGDWALVRMRGREKRENWLLIKGQDAHAGRSADGLTNRYRSSVMTGRTMRSIAAGTAPADLAEHGRRRPRFRKLQLATLRDAPPEGERWMHELKFDGYRCLAAVGEGGARLYSRNGKDWSDRFGALCDPVAALPVEAALIDGEVTAGDGDFSALQKALKEGGELTFHAFDCLHLDGEDLTGEPLERRRAALEQLFSKVPPRGPLQLSPATRGDGAEVLAKVCKAGGEGIVSKRVDAPYRGGRGNGWIKSKCTRQAEFVIAGWSPSDKRGRPFASLLLGSFEDGRLVYRGRVGTGFDAAALDDLAARMGPLRRKTPPFDGDLPSEADGAHWIRPKLVAQVAYAEFTTEGRIRHGVYLGLREDKEAADVSARKEASIDSAEARHAGVRITHPDRSVYPEAGLTKGQVAAYYEAVAPRLLAHAADRPLALLRCPEGRQGDCFFQKHPGKGFPAQIGTLAIEEKDGGTEDYMYLSGPASVLGAVQMGALEFHVWGARRDRLERPDRMVFDLDPDDGLDFADVRRAAREIRDDLAGIGLESAAMVTGGKGVHVIVPLRRSAGWETVKTFARTFATVKANQSPERFTATMSKSKRKGRVFIDWLRNERGATAIAPYSLRARAGAPVAVPVDWKELDDLSGANNFAATDVVARLDRACPVDRLGLQTVGATAVAALENWANAG